MPEIIIDKDQIDAVFAEVQTELAKSLNIESALLSKADKDAPAEESEGSGEPASPPPDDSAPDEGSAPPPADEGSAPPMDEGSAPPPPDASAPDAGAAPEGDIAPAPTIEQLQAEYMQLPPEQLKMHFLACKAAAMASMGQDQGSPPAASPAAPPAPAPAAPAPMAMSGKVYSSPGNGGKTKLGKSEAEVKIESLEKELKLQKDEAQLQSDALMKMVAAVDAKLSTPIRKAVTGVSDLRFIQRTETDDKGEKKPLTKSEVSEKLKSKIREGKLSKSDKDLVESYTVGAVDVTKIAHLLTDAK
jgi:hypothetical protein